MRYSPPSTDGLFQNQYRIPSARRPGYDYSQAGAYFITICTAHREPYFGYITPDPTPHLIGTSIAAYTLTCWQGIPQFHPFVTPGAFILMPDHLHGILFFQHPPGHPPGSGSQFGPHSGNLASVVRGFKSAITT